MKVRHKLTNSYLEALRDFRDERTVIVWDTDVRQLRATVGPRKTSFSFFQQHRRYGGKLGTTAITLGEFPAISVTQARKAALIHAGRIASGRVTPGVRTSTKFGAALDDYIARARERGKSGSWARNLESLKRTHLAEFLLWPLRDLANAPAAIAAWHKRVTKESGPNIANQAARAMRAAYRRAAKLDRTLPPHNPCSAVEYNQEPRSQRALAPANFPKWRKAWDKIESPTRKALQMVNLLTGCRPGELARLKWSDLFPAHPETGNRMMRSFAIRDAKAKNTIYVPMSAAIARELKRARDQSGGSEWVFPGRTKGSHITSFDDDGLPAHGMMYRRTWRTVAAECKVDELIAHFCLGHIPAGISRGYVVKMTLASGGTMRAAQRTVSRRMLALLEGSH
jgi:integrase